MGGGRMFSPMKMKRKDLEDVNEDFSDFSLSSPARKIRRLDVIMEEEVEEVDHNLDRAIVLFKNVSNYPLLLHSPSNFSLSVDSDFISGIKNKYPWSSGYDNTKSIEEEATDNSMAVIPWAPPQFHHPKETDHWGGEAPDLMDAEQVGESAMEIEGYTAETLPQRHENGGLPQWQQQHCLIPQLPFNTSTPISWSR
ncbi:hypothetical protein M5689_015982 [Euphorbia peplus]|nr:hypothetical protein M5689_015982 [Euphorbia peplus]